MSEAYELLANRLLNYSEDICNTLLPEGRQKGNEYTVGNLQGDPGDSLSVNLSTGVWKDFSSDEGGGDLISLYAAVHDVSQGKARQALEERYGSDSTSRGTPSMKTWRKRKKSEFGPAPMDAEIPGDGAVSRWCYTNSEGHPLSWVCRVADEHGKKSFRQYSWSTGSGKWLPKGLPAPRPLYGLPSLTASDGVVLVVEGEKCADAAQQILGNSPIVTTWLGGCSGWNRTDWSPIAGRKVYIWPDSDPPNKQGVRPGEASAQKLAAHLHELDCDVHLIDVYDAPNRDERSWDVADAIEDGWDRKKIRSWIKEHAKSFSKQATKALANSGTVEISVKNDDSCAIMVTAAYSAIWNKLGLQLNSSARPITNDLNVATVINQMGLARCWYDANTQIEWCQIKGDEPEVINNRAALKLPRILQGNFGLVSVRRSHILDALTALALDNTIDPPRDWYNSVTWDEKPRVDTFLNYVTGAEDNEYTRDVSRNMWLSIATRINEPGYKIDNMVILEGEQGVGKSTLLEKMVGREYYTNINMTRFDAEEYCMRMQGYLIAEMSELHAMRASDVEHFKSFLCTSVDNYRAKYDKSAAPRKRRCLFVGTTNQYANYLMDPTGNRRFWPVRCGNDMFKLTWVEENRDQLLAEAKFRIEGGEECWKDPQGATEEQLDRQYEDPWESSIVEYMDGHAPCTVQDIARNLDIDTKHTGMRETLRIGNILRSKGYEKRREMVNGKRHIRWYKGNVLF